MKRSLIQDLPLFRTPESRPAPAFWMLVFVIVAVPLALAPGLQFLDVTPKLLVLVAGAGGVWLALAARNCFPALRQGEALYFWLLGLLVLLSILATVFSLDPVLSLAGSEGRRIGLPAWTACLGLSAAVPVVAGSDLRRRYLLTAIVMAGLVAAVYGFAQYLGFDPWINPDLYRTGAGELQIARPPSTLGHANYFAVVSLVAMFSAAGLALSGSTSRACLGWGGAAVVLAMAVVISGSRATWLGAAIGMVVLYARVGRRRALLAGLLGAAVLASALVFSPLGRPLRNRARSFREDPGIQARLLVWHDSLRLIAAHPLLGVGPDTYELGFPQVQSTRLAQHAPDHYAESPHNVFLDYTITAGIPAGLIFAALVAIALVKYAASSRRETLAAGQLAALVGGLVAMQFSGDTISTRLVLLTIVALSISTPAEPARLAVRGTVGGAAVVCLILAFFLGGRLLQADRALFQAGQAAGRGQIEAALQEGQRSRQSFPWTGAHAFAFSRMMGQLATSPSLSLRQRGPILAVAEESARAGLLHSSQPQIVFVHLASLQVLQGKQQEAQATLAEAVQAAPVWYRPRWLLAVLLAEEGQLRQAAEQAEAALELGARSHPEIAATCLKISQLVPPERRLPEQFGARVDQGLYLLYDQAAIHPAETRLDTPNGRWAFPYQENSLVTLPNSDLTFVVDVPAQARFRATVRMPLKGADPAWGVVRVNGQQLFSELIHRPLDLNLDLSRFAGQRIELQLAAAPTPQGQHASWVQWMGPRIVIEPAP